MGWSLRLSFVLFLECENIPKIATCCDNNLTDIPSGRGVLRHLLLVREKSLLLLSSEISEKTRILATESVKRSNVILDSGSDSSGVLFSLSVKRGAIDIVLDRRSASGNCWKQKLSGSAQ